MLQTRLYTGKAWPLIEGTGNIYGMYMITNINETRSEFFNDDKALHISFTLRLERVSEEAGNAGQYGCRLILIIQSFLTALTDNRL
ncbi:phage tail protein [Pectobacterium brasiliense]|uniref:phage tail protein n=1 Tax=Pectobacterium brasiliense TaxID=180957 RepID=UPI00069352D7